MNRVLRLRVQDITPEPDAVFRSQGIGEGGTVRSKVRDVLSEALDIFATVAQPVGIISEVSIEEFEPIFAGEGDNEGETLLEHIYPRAERLALFASTLGGEVGGKIRELFGANDFALGSMLDSVASLAADKTAEVYESLFHDDLSGKNLIGPEICVLNYSPGYCGWHISGQRKVFQHLEPERIGMSLTDGYLMIPLKSVTGLLVAGRKEIHLFENNYPFCRFCRTRSCRQRMRRLSLPRSFRRG